NEYDSQGRLVAIYLPGDVQPTETREYYLWGSSANSGGQVVSSIAAQRSIVKVRDGSADGLVSKTFADGLGRTVLACREVDPSSTDGGARESCVATEFDAMGRAHRVS